jgi:hypothetical protein
MSALPGPDEVALAEAAFRLRVPYPVAYRRMFAGDLQGRRVGSRWYVSRHDVERLESEARDPLVQHA